MKNDKEQGAPGKMPPTPAKQDPSKQTNPGGKADPGKQSAPGKQGDPNRHGGNPPKNPSRE